MDVINNRNSSPYAKSYAENEFNRLEKRRTEINALREADYRDQRELWQKKKEAFDNPSYDIEDLNKRLAAQKTQRDIAVLGPLEEQIKAAEVKLQRAKVDAIPSDIAKAKADLDNAHITYAKSVRELNKPDTLTHGGTQLERPYDPRTGKYGPYALPPGAPPPEEKPLTEGQMKSVEFALKMEKDLKVLHSELKNGKALTDYWEATKAMSPVGSNIIVSDEYRRAKNIMGNFMASYLSHVSGASVTPSEYTRNVPAYMPMPGDSDKDLEDKAQRQRDFLAATRAAGGQQVNEAIRKEMDRAGQYLFDKEAEKPPVAVASPAAARAMEAAGTLLPGRRIITPDGREIKVPRRASP